MILGEHPSRTCGPAIYQKRANQRGWRWVNERSVRREKVLIRGRTVDGRKVMERDMNCQGPKRPTITSQSVWVWDRKLAAMFGGWGIRGSKSGSKRDVSGGG